MSYNDLRDLDLAGIRWELTDVPMTRVVTPAATPTAEPNAPHTHDDNTPNIVPPMAPMGLDVARAAASRPTDAGALARLVAEFNHPLRRGATNPVVPHVAPNPNGLVVITDMPGADDDASGVVLSGAAGELMDKMLSAIGMGRDNVSIVPLLFWRTPGGRAPSRVELDLARPFVDRAIELLTPRVILTLGTLAATEFANATLPKDHGAVISRDGGGVIVPIFHPNYLLLKPAAKRDAWNALQQVQNLLKSA